MSFESESSLQMNLPWLLVDEYTPQQQEVSGHHAKAGGLAHLLFKSALCLEWASWVFAEATKLQGKLNSLEIN